MHNLNILDMWSILNIQCEYRMNIRLFTQVGGLVVKELNSILGVQGSNFINDIHYGQQIGIHN
jgi:hypothetical protein